MFRITYSYFRKDNNGKLIGSPIIKHVYNNDVVRYSIINFEEVEEIKEH